LGSGRVHARAHAALLRAGTEGRGVGAGLDEITAATDQLLNGGHSLYPEGFVRKEFSERNLLPTRKPGFRGDGRVPADLCVSSKPSPRLWLFFRFFGPLRGGRSAPSAPGSDRSIRVLCVRPA